jgi:hypothetical protein
MTKSWPANSSSTCAPAVLFGVDGALVNDSRAGKIYVADHFKAAAINCGLEPQQRLQRQRGQFCGRYDDRARRRQGNNWRSRRCGRTTA